MLFHPESLFKILFHTWFYEDSTKTRHLDRSPPAPRFSLLGYVWEVGHQIGFRYNVIIIDLPVVKEADR